jgi:hypothetical protein
MPTSFNLPSPYQQQMADIERRQKMSEILQQQSFQPMEKFGYNGIEAPISPAAGLAKMLQMALPGMQSNKLADERKERYEEAQARRSQDLTSAMQAGQGWTNPDTGTNTIQNEQGQMVATQANPQGMAAALMRSSDPQLWQMGLTEQIRMGGEQRTRDFAQNERMAGQNFQMGRDKVQNDYRTAADNLQRAHSFALQNNTAEAQTALQKAQQEFTAAQNVANQTFQQAQQGRQQTFTAGQQANQQAFTGGQNDLNRAADAAKIVPKPSTDDERKASGFADRMGNAESIIGDLVKAGETGKPGFWESAGSAVNSDLGNSIATGPRQQYRQAQEDWVRSKLRRESGAVIGDDEMEREIKVYFPQRGDGPDVLAQKAQARKIAQDAMVTSAGTGYKPAPITKPATKPAAAPAGGSGDWSAKVVE